MADDMTSRDMVDVSDTADAAPSAIPQDELNRITDALIVDGARVPSGWRHAWLGRNGRQNC